MSFCVHIIFSTIKQDSQQSIVSIVHMLGDGKQKNLVQYPVRARDFSSPPQHPDQLWGPPRLLLNLHQGLFTGGDKVTGV